MEAAVLEACLLGRADVLQQLFDASPNRLQKDSEALPVRLLFLPLPVEAVQSINSEALEYLTENLIFKKTRQTVEWFAGDTAFHVCCKIEQIDCLRMLLRIGCATDYSHVSEAHDVNPSADEIGSHGCSERTFARRNRDGKLALECSDNQQVVQCFFQEIVQKIAMEDMEGVRLLLTSELDVNLQEDSTGGSTLLHWAVMLSQSDNVEIINLLVETGGNLLLKNQAGMTPYEEAMESKKQKVAETLAALQKKQLQQEHVEVSLQETIKEKQATKEANGQDTNEEIGSPLQHHSSPRKSLVQVVEEKDIFIKNLKNIIDQILSEKGVLQYISTLKDKLATQEIEKEALVKKNRELHSFLVENHKIYAKNQIDPSSLGQSVEQAVERNDATVSSLKQENRALRASLLFERKVKQGALKKAKTKARHLRKQLKRLEFQLRSRHQLSELTTHSNGDGAVHGKESDSSLENDALSSESESSEADNELLLEKPLRKNRPKEATPSLANLVYDVFWGEGDSVYYEVKEQ